MRIKIKTFGALVFLAFGLVSCSQESPTAPNPLTEQAKKSGKLSPPLLISDEGQQISLKNYLSEPSQVWSLSDRIEFPDRGRLQYLEVQSKCTWDKQEITFNKTLFLEKSFHLFQILPESLIFQLSSDEFANCSAQFVARSDHGDRHTFALNLQVSQIKRNRIQMSLASQMGRPIENENFISYEQSSQLLIRSYHPQTQTVELICENFQVFHLFPQAQNLSYANFDFSRFSNDPQMREKWVDRPFQWCRILSRNKDQTPLEISPRFNLQLNNNPLQLLTDFESQYNVPREPHLESRSAILEPIFINRKGYPLLRFKFINPSDFPIQVRMPELVPARSQMGRARLPVGCYILQDSNLHLIFPPSTKFISNNNQVVTIEVPPHSTHLFTYSLKAQLEEQMPALDPLLTTVIHVPEIYVDFVRGDLDQPVVYDRTVLPLPREVVVSHLSQANTNVLCH